MASINPCLVPHLGGVEGLFVLGESRTMNLDLGAFDSLRLLRLRYHETL